MNLFSRARCLVKKTEVDCLHQIMHEMKLNNKISSNQYNMIIMMLKLSQVKVRDVMVPRANMHTINITDSQNIIVNKINEARHSRYPVIADNKDEILGILLAKNLLIEENYESVLELCIKPFFVPESKRLDILLKEFQKNHTHMAIVKDEYNGVAGLITLEDVIEEILGEIEDEDFTQDEKLSINEINKNVFLISGRMTIEEVNEATGTNFKSNAVDTIGGYISQNLGYFPKSKTKFKLHGIKFKIEHADAKNIKSIKMYLPESAEK